MCPSRLLADLIMFCVKLLSDKAEYCMAEYDVSAVRTILEDVTFDVYVQMLFSC